LGDVTFATRKEIFRRRLVEEEGRREERKKLEKRVPVRVLE
jgi:hypothetical protein